MSDFKDVSHISGGYTGNTGYYVGKVDKELKDMSLIEAKEYYSKKLEETYKLERRYSEQLKVITLMLHTEKSDEICGN